MNIKFNKYHGCGNDFIIIDNTNSSIHLSKEEIADLCERHTGIGADGLILVERRNGHYYMNYYNADGSPAEICGNGLRCTSAFIYDHLDNSARVFTVESSIGKSRVAIGDNDLVAITLPKASFDPEDIGLHSREPIINLPTLINGRMYRLGYASMGNPHLVVFGEEVDRLSVRRIGSEYESVNGTGKPINVNFAQIVSRDHIIVETWERGVGKTLACGTGACATANILYENGLIDNRVTVTLPGGDLFLTIGDEIKMIGPSVDVFSGTLHISDE